MDILYIDLPRVSERVAIANHVGVFCTAYGLTNLTSSTMNDLLF